MFLSERESYLSIRSIYLSIYLSIYVWVSIYLSIYLSIIYVYIYLCIYVYIYLYEAERQSLQSAVNLFKRQKAERENLRKFVDWHVVTLFLQQVAVCTLSRSLSTKRQRRRRAKLYNNSEEEDTLDVS